MSEKILDFLTQAANGNALEAEQTFKELISQKVQDRLEDIRADVMSKEEVEIDEETLDELSKKTLGSYVNKSTKDIANKEFNASTDISLGRRGKALDKLNSSEKRQKGIATAVKKLTKD